MRFFLLIVFVLACQTESEPVAPGLVLGHHDPYENVEATFAPFVEGGTAEVEVGGQGSLMVVAAARLPGPVSPDARYTVEAALVKPDGSTWARPKMRIRPQFGVDGQVYLANLFLILILPSNDTFDRSWENAPVTLELSAAELGGSLPPLTASVHLTLVAATGQFAPSLRNPDAGSPNDSDTESVARERPDSPRQAFDTFVADTPAPPPPDAP